jgi:hypothetical protein
MLYSRTEAVSAPSHRPRHAVSRQRHRRNFLSLEGDLWRGDSGKIVLKIESSNVIILT